MKKLVKKILSNSFGVKGAQRFYENLFRLSLKGMNYGNGGDYQESGELNALSYIRERSKHLETLTIFDVGANIGNYAYTLASCFDSNSTIHSFEPSEKTFQIFLKNTQQLKNVRANNFGLSDTETTLELFTNKDGSGLASLYSRNLDYLGISMDKSEEIKLTTIDRYCEANNIRKIDFLKIDVEGHELSTLKGARNMLNNKAIDYIQFEFGGTNIDSRVFFRDFFSLLSNDFRIYRIVKNGLVHIPRYSITQEIFVSINYLAESKSLDKRDN